MKRSEIAGLIRAMDNELKMQYGDDTDPEVEAAIKTLQSEPGPLAVGFVTPTNLERYLRGKLTTLVVYSEVAQDDELPVAVSEWEL